MKWQCALLQRWLPEYPDGDLPGFWRGRLQAHLDRCPTCRAEQTALREVVEAIQAAPATDQGPEFWAEFSREMHLKLVRADQEGQMAAPPSPWWRRVPYLVGAPALAVLLLWVASSYLNPVQPVLAPAPQVAQKESPAEKMAAQPPAAAPKVASIPKPGAAPIADATREQFTYAAIGDGQGAPDEDLDLAGMDLETVLAGMTDQEKELFLKKLKQRE